MPYTLTIPQDYGYAAVIALGVIPVLSFAQGLVVSSHRRAAKVPYPNAYASHDQAKADRAAYKFNCAQRAHANLLENMGQTIAMLLFSALFYPRAAAYTGLAWVISRVLYAYGYINSEVNGKGRSLGGGMWLAQGGLWGMCIAGALTLI